MCTTFIAWQQYAINFKKIIRWLVFNLLKFYIKYLESSIYGWSSRASSAMSQRSSSGGLRLSTFSAGTSIASDNSGPFLFSFVLRKRASTIGTRIPLPKRAISCSSGDSLRVPDREVFF